MKNLQSLVQLVTKHKQKKIKIDPLNSRKNNLYNKVFHGILNKTITTENQLANEFLHSSFQDGKYRLFIYRFKNEIFKLFQNFDMEDKNQKKTYREHRKCYQKMIAMQTLQDNGMVEEAANIAKYLLLASKKLNLPYIQAECLDILSFNANLSNNINEYNKYKLEHEKCLERIYNQVKAMNLYNDIKIMLEKPSLTKLSVEKVAKKKINEFIKIKNLIKNENLEYNYFKIQAMYFQVLNKHKECIKICKQAIKWLSKSSTLGTNYTFLVYFEYRKLLSFLQINDIVNSEKSANSCLDILPKTDNNRLVVYDVYMLICFNNKDYNKALEIYQNIKEHPRSKYMGQDFNERLEIFEGYLYFLSNQYNLTLLSDPVFNNIRHFNFDVFYKRVSVYKSHKKGFHVAMLVLQILNYLQNNRFDMLTQRMESLMKYRQTYLRKDDNYRVNCFLKMLSILERLYNPADKNSLKVIRSKSHRFLVNMNKNRIQMEKVYKNYEIIPFEHLWEEIILLLEKRHFPHKIKDKGISV